MGPYLYYPPRLRRRPYRSAEASVLLLEDVPTSFAIHLRLRDAPTIQDLYASSLVQYLSKYLLKIDAPNMHEKVA